MSGESRFWFIPLLLYKFSSLVFFNDFGSSALRYYTENLESSNGFSITTSIRYNLYLIFINVFKTKCMHHNNLRFLLQDLVWQIQAMIFVMVVNLILLQAA